MVTAGDMIKVTPLLRPTGPLIEYFEVTSIGGRPTQSEFNLFSATITNNPNDLGIINAVPDWLGNGDNSSEYLQTAIVQKLNISGRNYMVEQGGNSSLGVAVLANVSDSFDSLYFHLRENPNLCNIHRTSLV